MITLGENAYITLANFKAWCDLRNYNYSCKSDADISAAIVRASLDYIDSNYTFKGDRLDSAQAMQLPTNEVTIANIQNGAAQASWQALNSELFIDVTAQSKGYVTKEREKLDTLETETEYEESTAASYTHSTAQIDRFLSPYTISGYGFGVARVI